MYDADGEKYTMRMGGNVGCGWRETYDIATNARRLSDLSLAPISWYNAPVWHCVSARPGQRIPMRTHSYALAFLCARIPMRSHSYAPDGTSHDEPCPYMDVLCPPSALCPPNVFGSPGGAFCKHRRTLYVHLTKRPLFRLSKIRWRQKNLVHLLKLLCPRSRIS